MNIRESLIYVPETCVVHVVIIRLALSRGRAEGGVRDPQVVQQPGHVLPQDQGLGVGVGRRGRGDCSRPDVSALHSLNVKAKFI